MRKPLLVLAVLAGTSPAAAETTWAGTAFLVSATTPCAGSGIAKGDFGRLLYRPTGSGLGNGANSTLTYISSRSSFTMYVPNNGFRPRINYGGTIISSTLSIVSKTGGILDWATTPSTFGINTNDATVTAGIANFFGITGCTVSLRGSLVKIP